MFPPDYVLKVTKEKDDSNGEQCISSYRVTRPTTPRARELLQSAPSPVGDAVVIVVVQSVVFRALPGDGGLGAATDTTSKNNGLPCLTRDLTQWDNEFWGNCKARELFGQCQSSSASLYASLTGLYTSGNPDRRRLPQCRAAVL